MRTGSLGALPASSVRAFWLSLALAAGLAACGDDSPAPDPDGGPPLGDGGLDTRSFLELCAQPELYCARLYECAEPERLADDQGFFDHEDEASCVVAQDMVTGLLCAALDESLAAGRLTLDRPKLAACVDHMEALACYEYVHGDPSSHGPCQGSPFLAPNVPLGGECAQDAECAAPADLCSATEEALGECVVAPVAGEPCAGGRCGDGLLCVEDVCVEAEGRPCLYDADCAEDLWCDQPGNDYRVELEDPELQGVCAAPRALGESCDDVGACGGGTYCDDTGGADPDGFRRPGHCAEPRGAGEACNEPADCVSFECRDDGRCA